MPGGGNLTALVPTSPRKVRAVWRLTPSAVVRSTPNFSKSSWHITPSGALAPCLGLGGIGAFDWLSRKSICSAIRASHSAICVRWKRHDSQDWRRVSRCYSRHSPRDLRLALFATIVPQPSECLGITFTRQDRVEDRRPRLPGDVGDGVVKQDVHLIKGLLHSQQVLASGPHQTLPMAHQRAHRTDGRRGTKGRAAQPHAVQILQPLAILHVAFAPWRVLDVTGVDQTDLQSEVSRTWKSGIQ